MSLDQGLQPGAERLVPQADAVKETLTRPAARPLERLSEEDFFPFFSRLHSTLDNFACPGR